MKMAKSVAEYLEGNPWEESLEKLRGILNETELNEELKWGTPHYTINKKIVVGIAGFSAVLVLEFLRRDRKDSERWNSEVGRGPSLRDE